MELIVILGVIFIALIAGIWATRAKPVENALEVMDNVTPPAKPNPVKQPKVVATTGKPKAAKKPAAKKPTDAKKPAVAAKSTRSRKTTAK